MNSNANVEIVGGGKKGEGGVEGLGGGGGGEREGFMGCAGDVV